MKFRTTEGVLQLYLDYGHDLLHLEAANAQKVADGIDAVLNENRLVLFHLGGKRKTSNRRTPGLVFSWEGYLHPIKKDQLKDLQEKAAAAAAGECTYFAAKPYGESFSGETFQVPCPGCGKPRTISVHIGEAPVPPCWTCKREQALEAFLRLRGLLLEPTEEQLIAEAKQAIESERLAKAFSGGSTETQLDLFANEKPSTDITVN